MSQDLLNKAIIIRDEQEEWANTAERVGSWLVQAEKEKADTTNAQGTLVRTPDGTIPEVDTSGLAPKENAQGLKVVYSEDGEIPDSQIFISRDPLSGTLKSDYTLSNTGALTASIGNNVLQGVIMPSVPSVILHVEGLQIIDRYVVKNQTGAILYVGKTGNFIDQIKIDQKDAYSIDIVTKSQNGTDFSDSLRFAVIESVITPKVITDMISTKENTDNNVNKGSATVIDTSSATEVVNTSITGTNIVSTQGYNTCTPIAVPQNTVITIATTNGTKFKERWVLLKNATDKSGYNNYQSTAILYSQIQVNTESYNYIVLTTKEPTTTSILPYLKITTSSLGVNYPMEIIPSKGYTIEAEYEDTKDWHEGDRTLAKFNIFGHDLVLTSKLVQTVPRPFETRLNTDLTLTFGNKKETYSFWNRPYHKDIFSIRLKYPIVELSDGDLYLSDGKLNTNANNVTVVTPVPENLTGATMSYSSASGLIIKNTSGGIVYQKQIAGYTSVTKWVEDIQKDLPEYIELNIVNAYLVESFNRIGEFTDLPLTKYTNMCDIYGNGTANKYYDCYPAMIKTNSLGMTHKIVISFEVTPDQKIEHFKLSYDGVVFIEGLLNNQRKLNEHVVADVPTVLKSGKTVIPVPFFIGSHYLQKNNFELYPVGSAPLSDRLSGTTARFERNLQWLKDNGFVSLNVHEAYTMMQAGTLPERSYVLTTDEINIDWWVDNYKRSLFFSFNCKPTLVVNPDYRINIDVNGNIINQVNIFTKENISDMLQQGWYVIMHPSAMAVSNLGYAQFTALIKQQEKWLKERGVATSSYVVWHVGNSTNFQDTYVKSLGLSVRLTTSEGLPCGNNIRGDFAIRRRYWDETASSDGTGTSGGMTFDQFVALASKYL